MKTTTIQKKAKSFEFYNEEKALDFNCYLGIDHQSKIKGFPKLNFNSLSIHFGCWSHLNFGDTSVEIYESESGNEEHDLTIREKDKELHYILPVFEFRPYVWQEDTTYGESEWGTYEHDFDNETFPLNFWEDNIKYNHKGENTFIDAEQKIDIDAYKGTKLNGNLEIFCYLRSSLTDLDCYYAYCYRTVEKIIAKPLKKNELHGFKIHYIDGEVVATIEQKEENGQLTDFIHCITNIENSEAARAHYTEWKISTNFRPLTNFGKFSSNQDPTLPSRDSEEGRLIYL